MKEGCQTSPSVPLSRRMQGKNLLGVQEPIRGEVSEEFFVAGLYAELSGRLFAPYELPMSMGRHT